MTISRTVYNQLFEHSTAKEQVIRLRPTEAKAGAVVMSSKHRIQMWTKEEHERFLEALEMYPSGPWKKVADHIGTKTPRQTMTHAQKYRQKIYRRQRGLRNQKRAGADGKMATSPNGVADLSKNGQNDPNAANAAHSGFGLLDILAYSAAAAQSQGPPPNAAAAAEYARQQEFAQKQAYTQAAPAPAHTSKPPSPAPQQQNSPSSVGRLCNNSHLPPLSEILHLRGSQVAQQ